MQLFTFGTNQINKPIINDAVSFLLLVRFEVAANKNHAIYSGRVRDTGKLKKQGNFELPRIRKECAPKFKTLADYVIPRKKTEALWIGASTDCDFKLCPQKDFKWPKKKSER